MEEATPQNDPTKNQDIKFEADDVLERKILAALSYLIILIIIPYFTSRQDRFVHFHLKQGVIVLVCWIAYWITSVILNAIPYMEIVRAIFFPITALLILILMVIGILNCYNYREKELPILGYLARKIVL
jgi:uncharacterized membrane protein